MFYYEYWDLKKSPFDNVPDPTMYAECHVSMENAIAETLFAIEEGNECIAVIVGDVGLGKTLSIRIIIDSLDHDKYKIALVTNPDMSFIELVREIIGQLTGKQCEERRRINLLEIFNKILFETIDEGKKVLIFVDEANAISPANLESLRLLTNMQDDQRNLFTIVLAGQLELARRLEHPKRANLLQRIGTFSRIDKIDSVDLVRTYVETRLKLAGGSRKIFTDDAYDYLWEYSDYGVPRLINKVCKLSLKAGETNQFAQISGEVVRQIGERFRHLAGPAVQKRRPRKKLEVKVLEEEEEKIPVSIEPATLSVEAFKDRRRPAETAEEETIEPVAAKMEPEIIPEPVETIPPVVEELKLPEEAPVAEQIAEPVEERKPLETVPPVEEIQAPTAEAAVTEETAEPVEERKPLETVPPLEEIQAPTAEAAVTEETAKPVEEPKAVAEPAETEQIAKPVEPPKPAPEPPDAKNEILEEMEIEGFKVAIAIPYHVFQQAHSATHEYRLKVAGALAAQILKKYPELTSTPSADPISIWSDIREFVAGQLR
ncbi:MAG: AAA family ATPase [Syntrophaceae bacterium]